jgi:hypothetical protein
MPPYGGKIFKRSMNVKGKERSKLGRKCGEN